MQPHSGILHSHEKEGVPRAAAVRVTPEDAMLSGGSQSLQDTRRGVPALADPQRGGGGEVTGGCSTGCRAGCRVDVVSENIFKREHGGDGRTTSRICSCHRSEHLKMVNLPNFTSDKYIFLKPQFFQKRAGGKNSPNQQQIRFRICRE